MEWFRVYHDIIDDPKFMTLPLEVLGFWVAVLSVASSRKVRGTLPDIEEIAFRTRQPIGKTRELVEILIARKFVVEDKSGRLSVYKWDVYQRPSDDAAALKRRQRERTKSRRKVNQDYPNSQDLSRDMSQDKSQLSRDMSQDMSQDVSRTCPGKPPILSSEKEQRGSNAPRPPIGNESINRRSTDRPTIPDSDKIGVSRDMSRDMSQDMSQDCLDAEERREEKRRALSCPSSERKLSTVIWPQQQIPLPPGASNPVPPTAAAAPAAAGGDTERLRLEEIARTALGARFDLESVGQAIGAWLVAYPAEWIEPALLEAVASAPPNKFAAYTHKILLRCKQDGKFAPSAGSHPVNGSTHRVSKSQAAADAMRLWAESQSNGKNADD